jgi:hypothetical protein
MARGPIRHFPKRTPRSRLEIQRREAIESGRFPSTLDHVEEPIAVVNEERQLIYGNHAFQRLAGERSMDEMLGGRPGEILGCAHAEGSEEGCGTAEECRFCGAAQAIVETLKTRMPSTRECHISASPSGRGAIYDFLVRALPFEIAGNSYILLGFNDIRHQKRRLALERIFFHDIMNTASSFKLHLDLLAKKTSGEGREDLFSRLQGICDALVEEIQGQRVLMSAENGTLTVQRSLMDSRVLVTQLIGQLEGLEMARGRKIAIAPFSKPFPLISDDSLLKRVLTNMLKNALEASPEGATVAIGFRSEIAEHNGGKALFMVTNPTYMEPEVQRQVFTRYFSTKGSDRGLGTWGMKLLAEEYLGGKISFESSRENGTTFTLSLPLRPKGF